MVQAIGMYINRVQLNLCKLTKSQGTLIESSKGLLELKFMFECRDSDEHRVPKPYPIDIYKRDIGTQIARIAPYLPLRNL